MQIDLVQYLIGFNGYDLLTAAGCLVAYVLAVKYDEIKWKKGFRL